jgi:adenine C2-methylase RlmN of 23S rRNA A2503 and tRNA A37
LQANEEVLQQQQVRGPASLPTQPPTKATLLIEYIMLRGINDTQEDAHRCVWCVWCVWCVHGLCVCVYVYGCVCV